jgi:transposase InsO family protein
LKNNELVGSVGRVASAADNAAIESFHSLLKKNVLNSRRWDTREELRLAMVTRIEKKYHRQRRKRRLGRMTPVEFEVLNGALQTA